MSCTSIAETENGETGVLSLSTTFMRQVFSRFGEVILVDGTHKTSRYNYELLAFITMNNFGEGRFVNTNYAEEMANVMRFTTYCVAEQMEPQYAATLSKSENYKYEVSTDDPDELYASSMPSYNCVPSALTFLCACYSMVLH
ncbi:hypothetical protein PC121_g2261 [Phytophthora cactorum]|nr:hypothetical protein PC121_g2261 [Phytophthora cactorum]